MQVNKIDSQIQKDVLDELKWDTRLDETEVGVSVHRAIVTLTGTVSSWSARLAAREAAHRVAGVHDVADELEVRLYPATTPTDAEIAEAVRNALKWHALVPERRLQTTVSGGLVTLTGSVDYASQRQDAVRAIEHLSGVAAVINEIKISPPTVSSTTLRLAIEGALDRHALREAKNLTLDIEGGKVTVSGDVQSLGEREAVVGAVWGTRGVNSVVDRTHIR